MINGSDVIIHNSNGNPFALELCADLASNNGQVTQGSPLYYILHYFRIDTGYSGIDGRIVRFVPKELKWTKHINGCGRSWIGFGIIPSGEEQYLNPNYFNNLGCVWDKDHFLVMTRKYNQKELLEDFFKSFQKQDAAIWLSHGQFSISNKVSLTLGIKSRLPTSLVSEMAAYDQNLNQWRNDPKFSNLVNKLRDSNRRYYNLQVVNKKPDGELVYYLNVRDPAFHNSGLYTQFEMDAWINNQGPIVKGAPPLVRPEPAVQQTVNEVAATVLRNRPLRDNPFRLGRRY